MISAASPLSGLSSVPGFDPHGFLQSPAMPTGIGEHTVLEVLNLFLDGVAEQLRREVPAASPTVEQVPPAPAAATRDVAGTDSWPSTAPRRLQQASASETVEASREDIGQSVLCCIRAILRQVLLASWGNASMKAGSDQLDLLAALEALSTHFAGLWRILGCMWDAQPLIEKALAVVRRSSSVSPAECMELQWPSDVVTQRMDEVQHCFNALRDQAVSRTRSPPREKQEKDDRGCEEENGRWRGLLEELKQERRSLEEALHASRREMARQPTNRVEESLKVSAKRSLSPARQWVTTYTPPQVAKAASVNYPGGLRLHFADYLPAFQAAGQANLTSRDRLLQTLLDPSLPQRLFQLYCSWDRENNGFLTWARGEIRDFSLAAFRQYALTPPSEAQVYQLYMRFDLDRNMYLDARECLCLVDALLRAVFCATLGSEEDGPDTIAASSVSPTAACQPTEARGWTSAGHSGCRVAGKADPDSKASAASLASSRSVPSLGSTILVCEPSNVAADGNSMGLTSSNEGKRVALATFNGPPEATVHAVQPANSLRTLTPPGGVQVFRQMPAITPRRLGSMVTRTVESGRAASPVSPTLPCAQPQRQLGSPRRRCPAITRSLSPVVGRTMLAPPPNSGVHRQLSRGTLR